MLPFARSFAFRRLLARRIFFGAVLSAGQQPGQLPPAAGTPQAVPQSYKPITGEERFRWFAVSTVGPTSLLLAGPLSAGWGTLRESPEEYGRTWKGFGQRYGMRLTGIATSNAIEGLSGAVLREDPRYIPAPAGASFGRRTRHVFISTFAAYRPDGSRRLRTRVSRAMSAVIFFPIPGAWKARVPRAMHPSDASGGWQAA